LPDPEQDAQWHQFWSRKLGVMGRQGVHVFARPLSYRNKAFRLPDGSTHTFLAAEEKGVDVRMALDIVRMAHRREYDVALILSQDQDLSEVAAEIRSIAREQGRWIKIASAFPFSPVPSTGAGLTRPTGSGSIAPPMTHAWTGAITGGGSRRPRVAAANSPS